MGVKHFGSTMNQDQKVEHCDKRVNHCVRTVNQFERDQYGGPLQFSSEKL